MPAIFEHPLIVSEEEIDGQGHVNNLEYLRWMQDAAVAHSAAQGWGSKRYIAVGAGWVVRSHRIEYLQSALLGDELIVFTWVASFQKVRSLRKYQVIRKSDGVTLAKAETDWVYIGLEHRVPRRVPDELIDAFEVVAGEPTLTPIAGLPKG